MTPIERAARAMYDNVNPDWDWNDPDAALMRRMYWENARAAIVAIREPSAGVLAAMVETLPVVGEDWEFSDRAAVAHWHAMTDAILKEG